MSKLFLEDEIVLLPILANKKTHIVIKCKKKTKKTREMVRLQFITYSNTTLSVTADNRMPNTTYA